MRLICLVLVAGFLQINCSQNIKVSNWTEVKSEKAGFSVNCPNKTNSNDLVSVEYDDKKKTGFVNCRFGEVVFFVQSEEWNVSENAEENSDRFFKTLDVRGIGDSSEIVLKHEGKKGIEVLDPEFQSIGQHFIIDKTAFHLDVTFNDELTRFAKKGKVDERQIEIAERFFNSFKLLKK